METDSRQGVLSRCNSKKWLGRGAGNDRESLLCGGQKGSGTSQTGGPRNSVTMQKASGRLP